MGEEWSEKFWITDLDSPDPIYHKGEYLKKLQKISNFFANLGVILGKWGSEKNLDCRFGFSDSDLL